SALRSGVMRPRYEFSPIVFACLLAGCVEPSPLSRSVETDWPQSARIAVYPSTAAPSFASPEGLTSFLEHRWPLADIRRFCIPERRHNPGYQNLVLDTPEAWKGRLFENEQTGFDKISWYASVKGGRVVAYSLGVSRGRDFWLLEIGTEESTRIPPTVAP